MLYYKNWPDFIQLLGDGLVTYHIQLVSLIKSGQLCHISVTVAVRVLINSGVAICPSQDWGRGTGGLQGPTLALFCKENFQIVAGFTSGCG